VLAALDRHASEDLTLFQLFIELSGSQYDGELDKKCILNGLTVGNGRVRNLGSVLLCGIAVLVTGLLYWMSERKKAAVGRRSVLPVVSPGVGRELTGS